MEVKKSEKANLEKQRSSFFFIGLATALAIVLLAFEWKQFESGPQALAELEMNDEEEELIPITQQELPPPPPPPPAPTVIEIVEDDVEIEEEMDIEETEIDEDTEVEIEEVQEEVVEEQQIFTIVEQMPEFPGGDAEMYKYLANNLKYSAMAKDAGIQGTVYIGYVVWKDGSIRDVQLKRGIGGGCDEEALRVVKNMPKWTPGKQRGKAVPVQYTIPIKFTLR